MTEKEIQICRLLKEGKSYSEIQQKVRVSPSKISRIKMQITEQIEDEHAGSSINSSATTTATEELQDTENLYFDNPLPATTSSREEVVELKRLELEHEERMFQLQAEEDEKKRQHEEKKLSIKQEQDQQKLERLNQRLAELENAKQQLQKADSIFNELEETEEFTIPEKLAKKYRKFIKKLLSRNGERWDLDEIEKGLDKIEELKDAFLDYCEEAGMESDDLEEWKVLTLIEADLLEFQEELEGSFFRNSVIYKFTEEWLKRLENAS